MTVRPGLNLMLFLNYITCVLSGTKLKECFVSESHINTAETNYLSQQHTFDTQSVMNIQIIVFIS